MHRVRHVIVVPASGPREPRPCQAADGDVCALIIDRQPLFQAALGNLLEASPLSANVLAATKSDIGLEMIRSTEIDLVFCELRAEPISGIDLVRQIADEGLSVPVILLGDAGDEPQLAAALATTAAGIFTKNAALEEFLVGVRAVISGHRAIGSSLMARLLERLSPEHSEVRQVSNRLSPTELEILTMVGQAQSIPTIAATRGISHKTVRNHLAKIYRKLELHGRTEAMLWAARMGLTSTY